MREFGLDTWVLWGVVSVCVCPRGLGSVCAHTGVLDAGVLYMHMCPRCLQQGQVVYASWTSGFCWGLSLFVRACVCVSEAWVLCVHVQVSQTPRFSVCVCVLDV